MTREEVLIKREIKYFHPSGSGMPNGHVIQRGGFIRECQLNSEAYEFDETIHPKGDLQRHRHLGGVIVCPSLGAKPTCAAIFKGRYLNRETGAMYDSLSATFEINGLSSKELLVYAKSLLDKESVRELLVNDLNQHKHYLVCVLR